MSILLDALKKSEEQRQLGATPTLQTPERIADLTLDERRVWIPAIMLLLAAAVIAWIGAAQFHRPEPATAPVGIGLLPTDVPVKPEITREELDSLANSPEIRPATTPMADFTAEHQPPATHSMPGESTITSPASQRVQSEEAVQLISSGKAEESAAQTTGANEEPITALVQDLSESAVAAQPDSNHLETFTAEPISFWQIPQSLRESMPELRITVLVYAVNPQDRFLLINGERLREKDEVSDGLVVEEIQRDRAIFTFRDYRFQVKS
jgi:general secretion pathway protein B